MHGANRMGLLPAVFRAGRRPSHYPLTGRSVPPPHERRQVQFSPPPPPSFLFFPIPLGPYDVSPPTALFSFSLPRRALFLPLSLPPSPGYGRRGEAQSKWK